MSDIEFTKNILQLMSMIENDINNTELRGATIQEFTQKLPTTTQTTIVNKLRELNAEGHVLFDEELGMAFIGDSGKKLLTKLKYKGKDIGSQKIIFNAPVSNSNIIQGDNTSANITVNFLNALQREIKASALPEEEKKTWLNRIKEFSSHPLLVEIASKVLGSVCSQ